MLGPDGVGKTTAFNTSRGQLTPNSGDVVLDGIPITMQSSCACVSLGTAPMESVDWRVYLGSVSQSNW